jgi:flavin reductase (DIM6/NTAB) family NADH-FMN oxidoreductase RutF
MQMNLPGKLRQIVRTALLGPLVPSQAFDFSLNAPQTEVAVWLHGIGAPRDVTGCHSVACPVPFMLCVGCEEQEPELPSHNHRASLKFYERGGEKRLLGEIKLQQQTVVLTPGPRLHLYKATACTNFCLPRLRRWTRSLYAAQAHWKNRGSGRMEVSSLDGRCNEIIFSCPRPVVLVSALEGDRGNLFPMNLMGPVGREYFVFALNSKNHAAPLVGQTASLALSTIPFDQAEQVRQLGKNHHVSSVNWSQLPFDTHPSRTLQIPVPEFALTVREMKIEQSYPLGSHTFFIARVVDRTLYSNAPEFHRIHGLYARLRRA